MRAKRRRKPNTPRVPTALESLHEAVQRLEREMARLREDVESLRKTVAGSPWRKVTPYPAPFTPDPPYNPSVWIVPQPTYVPPPSPFRYDVPKVWGITQSFDADTLTFLHSEWSN